MKNEEGFSERARKVLSLAQEEAQRFNHNYIGTEHILLGLVRETEGVAARVLANLGVDLSKVRSAVKFMLGQGVSHTDGPGLTPGAEKAVGLAVDEAHRMNHAHVEPEHLLVGLLLGDDGVSAALLVSLGASVDRVRLESARLRKEDSSEARERSGFFNETDQVIPDHPTALALAEQVLKGIYSHIVEEAVSTSWELHYHRTLMAKLGDLNIKVDNLYIFAGDNIPDSMEYELEVTTTQSGEPGDTWSGDSMLSIKTSTPGPALDMLREIYFKGWASLYREKLEGWVGSLVAHRFGGRRELEGGSENESENK